MKRKINYKELIAITLDKIYSINFCEGTKSEPCLVIETKEETLLFSVTTALQIYSAIDFLHQLGIACEPLKFETYELFRIQISVCNNLIEVRKSLVKLNEVNLSAYSVMDYILTTLLSPKGFGTVEEAESNGLTLYELVGESVHTMNSKK